MDGTLLVFNCHESWVHQLSVLGCPMDLIVGLRGRYTSTWDETVRPIPTNCRLISLREARESPKAYQCIIAHNITDLLDVKHRNDPKLLVIHSTIEGRVSSENTAVDPQQMKQMLHRYVELIRGHVVSVSRLKGASLGFTEDIVPFGADPEEYPPFTGELPCGLRISNFINNRQKILLWGLHRDAFMDLPVRIVGNNPDQPGVAPSKNWGHLKRLLQIHRFYIHTADPKLEDGYNMATMEAMAAGMPVLGNRHPSSPVEHGVSGFLSDDPRELHRYAQVLLENRELAVRMGGEARRAVSERFSLNRFKRSFLKSIERARIKLVGEKDSRIQGVKDSSACC